MPIQIFPQLQLQQHQTSRIPRAPTKDVTQRAIEQEQLARLQRERQTSQQQDAARKQAVNSSVTPDGKVDLNKLHEDYASNLDKVNPDLASQFRKTSEEARSWSALADTHEVEAQKAKQGFHLSSLVNGINYFKTTGDKQGALVMINSAEKTTGEDQKDWTSDLQVTPKGLVLSTKNNPGGHLIDDGQLDQLATTANERLSQKNAMIRHNDEMELRRKELADREAKSKVAHPPTNEDKKTAMGMIEDDDKLSKLGDKEKTDAAAYMASSFRSQIHNNPDMDQNEAQDNALKDAQNRLVTKKGWIWDSTTFDRSSSTQQQQSSPESKLPEGAKAVGTDKRNGKQVYQSGDSYLYNDGTEAK